MGWSSYNPYECRVSTEIMKAQASALVDKGLSQLGYHTVILDCDWDDGRKIKRELKVSNHQPVHHNVQVSLILVACLKSVVAPPPKKKYRVF